MRFREGQAIFVHLRAMRMEFDAGPPCFASCLLTLFRRKRLLGET